MRAIQWQTTKFLWMKYVVVTLIMALIGAGIGIQQVLLRQKMSM